MMYKTLSVAFGAAASCFLVHIGFGAFGLGPLMDQIGHALGVSLGTIAPGAPVHACGMESIFNAAAAPAVDTALQGLPVFNPAG